MIQQVEFSLRSASSRFSPRNQRGDQEHLPALPKTGILNLS